MTSLFHPMRLFSPARRLGMPARNAGGPPCGESDRVRRLAGGAAPPSGWGAGLGGAGLLLRPALPAGEDGAQARGPARRALDSDASSEQANPLRETGKS